MEYIDTYITMLLLREVLWRKIRSIYFKQEGAGVHTTDRFKNIFHGWDEGLVTNNNMDVPATQSPDLMPKPHIFHFTCFELPLIFSSLLGLAG